MTRRPGIIFLILCIFSAPDQRSLAENSAVRIMRVMNSLLKRVRAGRRLAGDPKAVKKLIKIRKWLDHSSPYRDENVNV